MDLAKELVSISDYGLKQRAIKGARGFIPDETHFLDALKDSLETGKTPADELLGFIMDHGGKTRIVSLKSLAISSINKVLMILNVNPLKTI